jgi:hypothetical protein
LSVPIDAQSVLGLGSLHYENFDKNLNNKTVPFFTSSKPLSVDFFKFGKTDSIISSHFIQKSINGTQYIINPIGTFSYGLDKNNNSRLSTGIGAQFILNTNKGFTMNLSHATYNSRFFDFENEFVENTGVVNSIGDAVNTQLGYHHKLFKGYIHYQADSIFDFMLGHDKNFIGDGHRSMLLSDYSSPYNFLKINSKIWKFKLTNIFANFKNIQNQNDSYWSHPNKFGAIHYLDFKVSNTVTLGFYESVIWGGKDTLNNRNFEWNYINPIIFYRPVEYSIGSSDNSLIGLNLKVKLSDYIYTYSQLIMDEFLLSEIRARNGWWANKYGYQFGLKWNKIFALEDVSTRLEFNAVRPYTFSHGRNMENYGHLNQTLSHPYGSNFREILNIISWSNERMLVQFKSIYAQKGLSTDSLNYGSDPFTTYRNRVNEFGNKIGQGEPVDFIMNELSLQYIILPKMNLNLEFGLSQRTLRYSQSRSSNFYSWLSIKSTIFRRSNDYF